MNMRETFVSVTNDIIENDPRVSLVLGGISVASFRESIKKYPKRVFDAGIMEQAGLGIAAGMAVSGMIPIYHTIAPFLAERAYEQLKIDFGYQNLGGNFVSNGASIDYSSFGATHQCPAEINILKQIPNLQIIVPGTAKEFEDLFRNNYANGHPTYYRLSREINSIDFNVEIGKAVVVREGNDATVIAVGSMLNMVLRATKDMDVTVLYYTTVAPFDRKTLIESNRSDKIMICEPYYKGGLLYDVINAFHGKAISIDQFGLPHEFCPFYGTTIENMQHWGLTEVNLRQKLEELIH